MINITVDNFEAEVLNSEKPVFVDFYANWCGPCKMMAPLVEELSEDFSDKMKFGKCDIDENMDIAQKYRIMSIPTFMIFKDGKSEATVIGAQGKADLQKIIEDLA